jgi:cytochrome c556
MRKLKTLDVVVATVLIAGLGGAVWAQSSAADTIAARQAFMKSTGASLKAATGGDAAAAEKLAAGFRNLPSMFPPGSDSSAGKTRAKAEIWSDAAGFKAASEKAATAADGLAAAVKGGDAAAIQTAGRGVQGTCGGCHTAYRGPAA